MTKPGRSARFRDLSRIQVERVFECSSAWLDSLADAEPDQPGMDIDQAMTLALGMWICACVLKGASRSVRLFAKRLESILKSAEASDRLDPFAHDSKLILLVFELLAVNGCKSAALSQFARQVGEELTTLGSVPIRLVGESFLLSHLGIVAPPPVPELTIADILPDRTHLLRATHSEIYSVCDAISSASLFGTCELKADNKIRQTLQEVLPPILIEAFREYDLELGARILRVMRYSGLRDLAAFRLGVSFLIDQQDPSGRFGRFARESAALIESNTVRPGDVETRLYLPITVNCLWSLAEGVFDDFALLNSFRHCLAGARI